MKHALVPIAIRTAEKIEISEEEFEAIRSARCSYMALLDVEEKFDIAVESFFDYERARLDLALRHMVTTHLTHHELAADVRLINRRLLNLLAAAKVYTDQLRHDFTELFGRQSSELNALDSEKRALRAKSVGFQVGEVLRDHIQHRGLPINTLYYSLTAKESEAGRHVQVASDPYLAVDQLRADNRVAEPARSSLNGLGDSAPLTPLLKEYMDCLCQIHTFVRKTTAERGAACTGTLREALRRGQATFGESVVVAAAEVYENGRCEGAGHIFRDLLELQPALLKKNAMLSGLGKMFVSTLQP